MQVGEGLVGRSEPDRVQVPKFRQPNSSSATLHGNVLLEDASLSSKSNGLDHSFRKKPTTFALISSNIFYHSWFFRLTMYECLNHKAVVILVAFILVYFRYEIQYNKIFSYFNFTDELIFFFFFSVLQSLYPYREKAQAVRLNGVI